jgi:site-specific recombinase XerD
MTTLRERMIEEMQIRNLSINTQDMYVRQVAAFAKYYNKSPDLLGAEEIRTYQLYLIHERKLSASSLNTTVCALKFLYRDSNDPKWWRRFVWPKRSESCRLC